MKYIFWMHLLLALEVYNRQFIDSFIVVDLIKKHHLGLTQSIILTLAFISAFTLQVLTQGRSEYI